MNFFFFFFYKALSQLLGFFFCALRRGDLQGANESEELLRGRMVTDLPEGRGGGKDSFLQFLASKDVHFFSKIKFSSLRLQGWCIE